MTSIFDKFTGQYTVSKTIRMELRPIGKTLDHIKQLKLVSEDEVRADKYKKIKPLIDDYHKWFIDEVLREDKGTLPTQKDWESLGEAIKKYQDKKSDDARKELEKNQKNLRAAIAKAFKTSPSFKKRYGDKYLKKLFGKELITKLLEEYWNEYHPFSDESDEKEARKARKAFSKFTTYFTGLHENRKNIYSADKEGVSIPWRIVNENFPKFWRNMQTFEKIKKECPKLIAEAENVLKPILDNCPLKDNCQLEDLFSIDFFSLVMTQKGIDFYNQVLGGVSETMDGEKQKGLNEVINHWNQQQKDQHPGFTLLYKQILSDRQSSSFTYNLFKDDSALLNAVYNFYKPNDTQKDKQTENIQDVINKTVDLLKGIKNYDPSRVYIGADNITEISNQLFGSWSYIRDLISANADKQTSNLTKISERDKKSKQITEAKYYDLKYIEKLVSDAAETSVTPQKKSILEYWSELDDMQSRIKDSFNKFKTNVFQKKNEYTTGNPLRSNESDVEIVKNFLDSVMDFFHRVKALVVPDEFAKDMALYAPLDEYYEALRSIIPLYNQVRSTLTKKVGEVEKFKLNFKNPVLADGW
ncbi:MAG: type V CRISPR-associated protein Cas12a/Cpf1, partial [Thermoguttaceae bacterium]|nr:type V CRISPR-associated protein Cas12a/Cpf1 [Thermoguttaceae bacterium]